MADEGLVLGVIPARSGSKRVPHKNIKMLGNRPLIAYTIEAAKKAKSLDYFFVSTDGDEIARISRECGAPVPFKRPAKLSIDCDSVPGYSPLLLRFGNKYGFIEILTFEGLWDGIQSPIQNVNGREIKNVTLPTDVFIGHTHKNNSEFTKISKISRHKYSGPLIRINTVSGLIDVTPNHSVINHAGSAVDASKLEIGDILAQPPINIGSWKHNDQFIGGTDLAWLLGFFVAEGSIGYSEEKEKNKPNSVKTSYHVSFSNRDLVKLERAKRIFIKYFHTKMFLYHADDGVARLSASNLKAFRYLKQCYTLNKSKRVPTIILNARRKIKTAFLDGYNAGDGATTKQKKWHSGRYKRFGSISQTLCLGLLLLVSQTTNQSYSIHCRDDKPNFTQIILNSDEHIRTKNPKMIKKLRQIIYNGWVYDVETDSQHFCTGVGSIRAHNTVHVLAHALEWYERRKKKQVSHVVCLQPTSVFKTARDIDRCVELAKRTGADTVITIAQARQHPFWCFTLNQYTQRLESFMDIRLGGKNLVWQNLPLVFYPNGAVYVTRRDMILDGRIYGDKIHGVLMPQERSVDLEEQMDFIICSALLPIIQKGEPLLKTSWLDT